MVVSRTTELGQRKRALRRENGERRAALTEADREVRSAAAVARLLALPELARLEGATVAGDIAITKPVPQHIRYFGASALGPGAQIVFSLAGSTYAAPEALVVAEADGTRRAARADEY